MDRRLCLVKHGEKPVAIRSLSEDISHATAPVFCMAATNNLLIVGTVNGAIRIIRIGTP